jgi:hypothetical protein
MKSSAVEFAKGALLPLPFLFVLGLLAWALVGRDGDLPGEVLLGWFAFTVVSLVSLGVHLWNRSRWLACGALASLVVSALLMVVAAILLFTAIGKRDQGVVQRAPLRLRCSA